jgi:hypothetical protein
MIESKRNKECFFFGASGDQKEERTALRWKKIMENDGHNAVDLDGRESV